MTEDTSISVRDTSRRAALLRRLKGLGGQSSALATGLLRLVLFSALGFSLVFPVAIVLVTSLKGGSDWLDPTTVWLPKALTLENFRIAWEHMDYPRAFLNSLTVALAGTAGQVISCAAIGYGFARFAFPGRRIAFVLVILILVLPPHVMIVPLYDLARSFDVLWIGNLIKKLSGVDIRPNLLNTHWMLIIPGFFGSGLKAGIFIYMFRQFFRGMPRELEDAALIDGAGHAKTFLRVMLPNAVPVMIAVALLSIVWYWSDVFLPSIYLREVASYTLPLRLRMIDLVIGGDIPYREQLDLEDQYRSVVAAGVLMSMIPVLLLYLVAQRHFIESVERSGIVG